MCIICPILKTQKLASVLLTLLCSGCGYIILVEIVGGSFFDIIIRKLSPTLCHQHLGATIITNVANHFIQGIGLSVYMYLCIEIDVGDWLSGFKTYYEYYAFGAWGSIFGWFAGIFGLISWNDMQERNGHVSCTLRIHGWCAAISVLVSTAAGAWSMWCCAQFANVFIYSSSLKCGDISCETIHWLWIWENILLTFIMIFSATSAFRMMNYGCGCKFCFFPCMCCCQIPIGGSSVQPETYPSNQPPPYYSNYPPQYQSYPTRYSSSTDSSSGSDDSFYIRTGTVQLVKVS